MKPNLGVVDRTLRILVAFVIAFLYVTGRISGTTASILGLIAVVLFVTSLLARCPAYRPFGLSTRKHPPASA